MTADVLVTSATRVIAEVLVTISALVTTSSSTTITSGNEVGLTAMVDSDFLEKLSLLTTVTTSAAAMGIFSASVMFTAAAVMFTAASVMFAAAWVMFAAASVVTTSVA